MKGSVFYFALLTRSWNRFRLMKQGWSMEADPTLVKMYKQLPLPSLLSGKGLTFRMLHNFANANQQS